MLKPSSLIDRFIDTCLRWGGIVDAEVAAEESSSLNAGHIVPTSKISADKIEDPTIEMLQRPTDGASIVYIRAGDRLLESPVTYDEWWRPQIIVGRTTFTLGKHCSLTWRLKSGPEVHFPTEKDLKEFFPPGHPERQKNPK